MYLPNVKEEIYMKKKIAVIAALSLVAVTVLSGCGSKADSQANGGKVKIDPLKEKKSEEKEK